jgi:hypothetical protein
MFLMASMLVILLVCGDGSIVIVVVLSSSSSSLCPSHLINVVVVAVATPPALKVDCYVFHGVGARRPPWLWQWQSSPYHQCQISVEHAFFSGWGLILLWP